MKKRLRIYVAGAISDSNPLTFLHNLRVGIRVCTEFMLKGYAPFCPFLDFMLVFQMREGEEVTADQIKEYSVAFLHDSVAIYVIPGWGRSKGTRDEIEEAYKLRIPVFFDKEQAMRYLEYVELRKEELWR